MSRREPEGLSRRHIHLYEGDWERMQRIYGGSIGVAKAIRTIVREICDKVERRAGVNDVKLTVDIDL